ncbi:malto-oligosyltrehalose synthase, partial [Streptomyces tricolor]
PGETPPARAGRVRERPPRPHESEGGASNDPRTAEGPAADHCLAFARSGEVVTVVTRLSLRLGEAGGWRETRLPLPPGRWADVLVPGREFTGSARVADLLDRLPVALLERVAED